MADLKLQAIDKSFGATRVLKGIDLDIKDVDPGKLFKQHSLTFHHRLGGFRANIPQTQDCCSVGNDRYQVSFGGVFVDFILIVGNGQAGFGHSR